MLYIALVIRGSAIWNHGNPMRDPMSLYNIVGVVSKDSEDIASESTENGPCRQPLFHLTPSVQEIPASIRINLISPKTRVIDLDFCR